MQIIRGRLNSADVINPTLRYNEDTDTVQYTPDGGATWVDDPGDDPRHGAKFAKPLKTTGDVRCDSSASMVAWVRNFIEYETSILTLGAGVTAVGNALLTLLTPIAPYALLFKVIFGVADTLFSFGSTALASAFTDETYDLMLCCFYCNIETDGTVTPGDLEDVQAQVSSDLNTTAAIVLNAILSLQGEMGVQNAGTLYDVAGDCGDCDCQWTYTWYFKISDGGWSFVDYGGDVGGTWQDGAGFLAVANGANAYGFVYETTQTSPAFDIPSGSKITEIIIYTEHDGNSAGAHLEMWAGTSRTNGLASTPVYYANHWTATQSCEGERDGAVSAARLNFGVFWIGAAYHVEQYVVKGFGDPPAFTGGVLS